MEVVDENGAVVFMQAEESVHSMELNSSNINPAYECDRCAAVFFDNLRYLKHIAQDHRVDSLDVAIYSCKVCSASFSTEEDLQNHTLLIHSEQTLVTCTYCDIDFENQSEYEEHVKICNSPSFYCNLCGTRFDKRKTLAEHLKNCHHRSAHERMKEKRYKCLFCGKRFVRRADMETHQRTHTGDKPYKCSQCDKCFVSNAELHHHLPVHTTERAYKCQYCGVSYKNSSTLTHHKRTVHVNPSSAACTYPGCPYVGKTEKLLKSHTRYAHTQYKAIQCNLCDRKFSTKSHLYDHQRRRHQPKSQNAFMCTATNCGRIFKRKSLAEKHYKQMHEQHIKPRYECKKCKHLFTTELELRHHVAATHSSGYGLQHYYCTTCYFVTGTLGVLREHMASHARRRGNSGKQAAPARYEIVADQLQEDPEFDAINDQIQQMLSRQQSSSGVPETITTGTEMDSLLCAVSRHLTSTTR